MPFKRQEAFLVEESSVPASVPAILDREPGKKRKAARGPDSEDTDPEVIEPAPKAAEQAAPEEPKGPEQPGATGPERPVPPPPPPQRGFQSTSGTSSHVLPDTLRSLKDKASCHQSP